MAPAHAPRPSAASGPSPRRRRLTATAGCAALLWAGVALPVATATAAPAPAPQSVQVTAGHSVVIAEKRRPRPQVRKKRRSRAPAPAPVPAPAPAPPPAGAPAEQVLAITNAHRANVGCAPLAFHGQLNAAAQSHAGDMVARKYFSHTNPEGATPRIRASAAGFPGGVGENIATGYGSADVAMVGWMNSPGHRNNILNCKYTLIGVGYDPGAVGPYSPGTWVQVFA